MGAGNGPEAEEERAPLALAWRPRAAYDIESAVVYTGEVLGMSKAAKRLYEEVEAALEKLRLFPEMGKPFSDSALTQSGYRSFLVKQYRVFHTYDDKTLTVWRVIHIRRDLDDYALVDFE